MQAFIGTFGEPQNPKVLQKPFQPVCDNWQEHALSPGEATPAGPFLWKGLFRTAEKPQPLQNLQLPQKPFTTSPNLRTFETLNLIHIKSIANVTAHTSKPENLENLV